jgi:hypothetical protein
MSGSPAEVISVYPTDTLTQKFDWSKEKNQVPEVSHWH